MIESFASKYQIHNHIHIYLQCISNMHSQKIQSTAFSNFTLHTVFVCSNVPKWQVHAFQLPPVLLQLQKLMGKTGDVIERPAKLQRLNTLRRSIPNCSKASLHGILKDVAQHGVPELRNPKQMTEAARQHLAQFCTYGDILQTHEFHKVDGSCIGLQVVNFQSLLHASCKLGGSFYQCFAAAMATQPSTPMNMWNVILYSDECLPANALGKAAKKVWVVYASFKELGRPALAQTQHWLPLFICRSSIVSTLEGHTGQVMKVVMEKIFLSNDAPPEIGLLSHGPSNLCFRIHYQLGFIVQDGASQKITFGLKGDSGSNFCLKCCNQIVFLAEGEEDLENAVLRATTKKDLVLASDDDALNSFDRLAARKAVCTPAEFQDWQQATGWSFSTHGILSSAALRPWLRPVTQYQHDYMHGMCSNGCLNIGIYLVLEHLTSIGLQSWRSMSDYCKAWTLPAVYNKVCDLPSLFTPSKVESYRKAFKVKITASEVLCLYPIVKHYVESMVRQGAGSHATTAFLKLCKMMDLLVATQHGVVTGQQLDKAAEETLHFFKLANWDAFCIKKFHWLLHYGDSLSYHHLLLPVWTMERKHKDVTTIATRVQNLKFFEDTLYTEVLSQQLHNLVAAQKLEFALEKNSKAPKQLQEFLKQHLGISGQDIFANKVLVLSAGNSVSQGDVVLVQGTATWDAAQILVNFSFAGAAFILASQCALVSYDSICGNATWTEDAGIIMVPAKDVLVSVTYTRSRAGLVTLIPHHLR